MSHVEAWLRYYDKYSSDQSKKQLIEAAWRKTLARVESKERSGGKGTDLMLSAMSATIVSLRLVDVEPVIIHGWTNKGKEKKGCK